MSTVKRSKYIDVMKGLLIILVVIGHLPFFDYNSRTLTLIYSFHMPAFLIIGGMLSHIDESTELFTILYKRVKGTLIPYFLFYFISFFLVPIDNNEKLYAAIRTVISGIGHPIDAINLPLWFLTFYFVAMTSFEIIEWLSYKIKSLFTKSNSYLPVLLIDIVIIAPLMYFAYSYARIHKNPRLPFNFEIAIFCLLFVLFGKILSAYIKKALIEINDYKNLKIFISVISIFVIAVLILYWYIFSMNNGRIDLNARDYKNALFMYIDAILGFIIFAYFSYFISLIPLISNILSSIGEYSLYILAYHVPSTNFTYPYIISRLPAIVGTTLSHNSIISIILLTSFGIWFSLIMALIHKLVTQFIEFAYPNRY